MLSCLIACKPESDSGTKDASSPQVPLLTAPNEEVDLSHVELVMKQIREMSGFDEDQLEDLLAKHNQKQAQVAADQRDNPSWVLYDVGAQVLSLDQVGETSFTLLLRRVTEAHSAGVDGGTDQLFTLIFSRQTRQLQRVVAGKLENWQTDGLQIVGGKQESCLGVKMPDHFSVIDLKQAGKTILTQALRDQPGESALYRVELKGAHQFDFITTSDQLYSGKAEQAQTCDVGDWMDKLETTYAVTCDEQQVCKVSKQVKRYAGCQEIGGCD